MAKSMHRWRLAAYAGFAAILFTAFVTASFPYADSISALLAPMRMKVAFDRQEMHFPFGARLIDVRLLSLTNNQLLFQSPGVTIAPRLVWLMLGRPGLGIRADIYGGVLDASLYRRAPELMVDFQLRALELPQIISQLVEAEVRAPGEFQDPGRAERQLDIALRGELSGSGSAQFGPADITAGPASFELLGRQVSIAVIDGLPPLDLGVVQGKLLLNQGVVSVRLRATGSDGNVAARGTIQLAPDAAHTMLRLAVWLTPTTKGRSNFGLLLKMLPHAPDDGPYQVTGVLTSPSVS
jgi:type II secretion system protein N